MAVGPAGDQQQLVEAFAAVGYVNLGQVLRGDELAGCVQSFDGEAGCCSDARDIRYHLPACVLAGPWLSVAFALTDCRPLRVSDDWTKWGAGGIALGPAVWASADGGRQYMNQDSLVTSPDLADGLIRHPAILPMYCRQLH